ncbi:hypothetical protein Tco_1252418 [Tanacetum coccineum]
MVLCRTISDHCPILLKAGLPDFGPKPYKVFDKWLTGDCFKEVVANSWTMHLSNFPSDIALKNKLKRLRLDIKSRTSNYLFTQNEQKENLLHILVEWDIKAEGGTINDYDIGKKEEWLMDLELLD